MKKIIAMFFVAMACLCAIAQGTKPSRGAAQATLEPQELYMTATVGDTVTAYLTLTNTGTVTISPLWSFSSSPGYIWTDGYNGDIPPAPGDNVRLIPVTYIPEAAGTHTAHLSMYLDGDFYDVDITGVAVESTEPQVTATPVITVEEHLAGSEGYDDYYNSYVTFTATGDGEVCLYVNGARVENPYTVYCSLEEEYCYVTATAQEEGKLISETAELDYIVPANAVQPMMESPMPEISVEFTEDCAIITATGTGEVTMFVDGIQVENPYCIAFGNEVQYITVAAVNQEDGMLPSPMNETTVEIPADQSVISEPGLTYTVINEHEAAVSGKTSDMTDVVIPETVEIRGQQYTVTAINSYAFYDDEAMISVSIPATVVSIGNNAFCGTNHLSSITVAPDNPVFDSRDNCNAIIETATNTLLVGCKNTIIPGTVTTIGERSFEYQDQLTTIDIPNSVTLIKGYAFFRSGLKQVSIPASVTAIERCAFDNCSSLQELELVDGLQSIGSQAFYGCSKLPSVVIPSTVTAIQPTAFTACKSMVEMTVDASNPVYDSRNGCNAIIETASNKLIVGCKVTQIPGNVTTIGASAFSNCSELTSITIPTSVTCIEGNAFYYCSALQSITIPNSVTEIKKSAFSHCSKLQRLVVPGSVTTIGSNAFEYCKGLTSVTLCNGVQDLNSFVFSNCEALVSVTLPNTLKTIGSLAFFYCKNLQSVTIPASVTSIGSSAFFNCARLESIVVEDGNTVYDSRNGCNALIRTSDNTLLNGCCNTRIPEDVRFIGDDAFARVKGLTSIKIPNSVKSIASGAFEYCYDLADVEIGSGVAYIGYGAFYQCSALENVTCWAVTPPVIQKDNTFSCFENYETAVLRVQQASLAAYQADDEWGRFTHIAPFVGSGPGDVNGDGTLDVDDVTGIIDLLLSGGQRPPYADLNGDGAVDIDDVTSLINRVLNGR